MILLPIGSRQRPVGGASLPVFYPRAGYTTAGTIGTDFEPLRKIQMPVPNANGPQPNVPGSALHPQVNA